MKGVVLVNCGKMGLDWNSLSLSGYLEALTANNAAHDDKKAPEIGERMTRFLSAHR